MGVCVAPEGCRHHHPDIIPIIIMCGLWLCWTAAAAGGDAGVGKSRILLSLLLLLLLLLLA